jgi:hypothetical protein
VVLPLVALETPTTPAACVPVAVGALFTIPLTPYAVPEVAFDPPWIAGVPAVLAVSTSSTAAGVMVPRPTWPPVWYSPELPSFEAVFQMAM